MARIGKLKRRVEVFKPSLTLDTMGGSANVWESVGSTWAKVEEDTSNRGLEYLQARTDVPYNIEMRQDLEVKPNYKITFDGGDLIISSVRLNLDKYTYQVIRATQKIV
jgi:head-tail adaptor